MTVDPAMNNHLWGTGPGKIACLDRWLAMEGSTTGIQNTILRYDQMASNKRLAAHKSGCS